MDWKAITDKAKQIFQQRGGGSAAKADAEELRGVGQEQGSSTDKTKAAAEALRDPGAPGTPGAGTSDPPPPGAGGPQAPS